MSNVDLYTGGILGLLSSAGPVAKFVVFILFLFSIISWTIILLKWKQFSRTEKEGERFIKTVSRMLIRLRKSLLPIGKTLIMPSIALLSLPTRKSHHVTRKIQARKLM